MDRADHQRSPRHRPFDRPRRRAMMLVALALALVAAGCGGSDDTTDGGSGETLEASVLSGEAMTVDGETFDLGSLAEKDLVVWFWAPW